MRAKKIGPYRVYEGTEAECLRQAAKLRISLGPPQTGDLGQRYCDGQPGQFLYQVLDYGPWPPVLTDRFRLSVRREID